LKGYRKNDTIFHKGSLEKIMTEQKKFKFKMGDRVRIISDSRGVTGRVKFKTITGALNGISKEDPHLTDHDILFGQACN
jgi:hypothetical protein